MLKFKTPKWRLGKNQQILDFEKVPKVGTCLPKNRVERSPKSGKNARFWVRNRNSPKRVVAVKFAQGPGFPLHRRLNVEEQILMPAGDPGVPDGKVPRSERKIRSGARVSPGPRRGQKERISDQPRALQGSSGDSIPPPDTRNRARGGQSPSGLARMHGVRRGRKGETESPTGPVTANLRSNRQGTLLQSRL